MPHPLDQALPPRGTALLLALAAALLAFRLGAVPLLGPDEPRYVRVAIEMQRAGEWVRPTLQGEVWLEKPPLYYWLAGAAFRILGETETAARLPSVLAGLALVGVTALVGTRLFGRAAGLRDQGWQFVDVFLLNHNVDRFLSTIHNHPGPPYYYVPVILLGLFPWSGLILPALGGLQVRRSRTDLFLLGWFLLPFLFFS